MLRFFSVVFLFLYSNFVVEGRTFYVDPTIGSMTNDGSEAKPWSTLEEVIAAGLIHTRGYTLPYTTNSTFIDKNTNGLITAGDTIYLLSGLHGAFFQRGAFNEDFITIKALENHRPILSSINLTAGSKWRFEDLVISSEPYGEYLQTDLIYLQKHGWHGPVSDLEVVNCFIYSTIDSKNWSIDDWLEKARNGIKINGDRILVSNCHVLNVNFGISLVGENLVAIDNVVENFAGDGMRALGPNILIEGNTIKNCYKINDNHDDGIQSFNLGTYDTRNVTIRGNTIINFEDPNQPLRGPLQGIGCFDGPFHNWVIENNVISVDHWHGISLYGAFDCVIRNNTVIDPTPDVTPGPSWIRINPNKDGTESENNTVSNNISNSVHVSGTHTSQNLVLANKSEYDENFTDYSLYDFTLIPSSAALEMANDTFASMIDITGTPRPQGKKADIGAYEYIYTSQSLDINNRLKLYPNPTSGIVHLSKNSEAIQVFNSVGHHLLLVEPNSNTIDLSEFANGIYYIKGINFIEKIVVAHR